MHLPANSFRLICCLLLIFGGFDSALAGNRATILYNSHVHTMISAGGLKQFSGSWVASVYYNKDLLMSFWRDAVIKLVRQASRAGLFRAEFSPPQLEAMLTEQSERRWIIKIQSFKSKEHFLRYAGRYMRRPPIAQGRVTYIGKRSVTFWAKDKSLDDVFTSTAPWKSSLFSGHSTFENTISTVSGTLACLRRAP